MNQQDKPKIGVGVGVMILRDGKVLLGQRHPNPKKADSLHGEGTWTMPGGKLEYGEALHEAVKRETKEETGIALKAVEFLSVNDDIDDRAHFVTIGFLAKDFEGEPRVMEPETIMEWRWFELDALPQPMYFPSARLIENYRLKRFYISR